MSWSFIAEAWAAVPEEVVARCFMSCAITSVLDGSEDCHLHNQLIDVSAVAPKTATSLGMNSWSLGTNSWSLFLDRIPGNHLAALTMIESIGKETILNGTDWISYFYFFLPPFFVTAILKFGLYQRKGLLIILVESSRYFTVIHLHVIYRKRQLYY